MTLAELMVFLAVIAGVYFALAPIQRRLERWLLSRMGRASGRKGQGSVYTINRKDH